MPPIKNRLKIGDFFGKNAPRPEKVIKNSDFSVKIYKSSYDFPRFGVVLSTSLDKRSTARNRIKRIVLGFFGANKDKFPLADYLFFPGQNMTKLKKSEIITLMKEIATHFSRGIQRP